MNSGGAPGGTIQRKPPPDKIPWTGAYFFTPSSNFTANLSC
jgi:hypothetical protein